MDNKPGCGCGCGGKSKFRLVLFALVIIILAAVGASQLFKSGGDDPAVSSDIFANGSEAIVMESTEHVPFVLDPDKVKAAELIPVELLSVKLSELGGENFRTITLAPQAEWQGDFTPERVAATLISGYAPNLTGVDVVEVYFLPAPLESEGMLNEVLLGKLVVEAEESLDSELLVVTRGYLPQELEFIKLWDQMWPEFMDEEGLDRPALTQAIIDKIGFEAYGMEYPFLDAERVENLPELLENYRK